MTLTLKNIPGKYSFSDYRKTKQDEIEINDRLFLDAMQEIICDNLVKNAVICVDIDTEFCDDPAYFLVVNFEKPAACILFFDDCAVFEIETMDL